MQAQTRHQALDDECALPCQVLRHSMAPGALTADALTC